MNREQLAEKAWDRSAPGWDARSAALWETGNRKTILPFIQEHLQKQAKIIDIGSGNGYGTWKLKEAGYQASGMDFSAEMVRISQNKYKDEAINFQQADISNMPQVKTATYDAAMVINVFEWTSNPQKALLEVSRILQDKAYIFAGILGPAAGPRGNEYRKVYNEEVIMNSMLPWEFAQLATENGFKVVSHYGIYGDAVNTIDIRPLPLKLKQSLSFMWVFMLEKLS